MKKRVHRNDKKNLPSDFKKCPGSLYFPLLLSVCFHLSVFHFRQYPLFCTINVHFNCLNTYCMLNHNNFIKRLALKVFIINKVSNATKIATIFSFLYEIYFLLAHFCLKSNLKSNQLIVKDFH